MNGPSIDIVAASDLWQALPDAGPLVERAVAVGLAAADRRILPGAELSIVLTDDASIRGLNRQWRGLDKPTNVLSFPGAAVDRLAEAPHLGDIVVAFETVQREAEAEGKSLADHTAHLVIHGLLHLLGYDHETDAEAEDMEAREVAALARLGIADPYADAGAVPARATTET
ncbi:rRNA maturation RNase YbeY [Chelatococcus sp. SYSU_G07232]|uniref:Endoribonuclease YbeY n=1 Tax=Chelatococcus albus TaxID=3047466 RepID=A0ABT7AHA0_9HYPH|nr:rRNA maturation RNase YbeY [Chelatococcus sp. SYSU_G07232]MDJ1158750.1 rRNA maturation RNase YbeY [Chelatococcus sp. SYSU_G07232]